jgi:hypothetical protein
MKITDIIRTVLDLVDQAEAETPKEPKMTVDLQVPVPDDLVRIKQIAGLMGTGAVEYSNSPEERVAGLDAVTAAGDDVHKSKNPADIRTNAPSMYPAAQWRGQ